MCTDCNEIEIPQGPAGNNGSNGTNGADGANGVSILYSYNSRTGTNTGSGTTEISLASYNTPANTLLNNGDELELYIHFEYASPNQVDIQFKIGGLSIYTFNQIAADDENFIFRIKISRVSQTLQQWIIEKVGRTVTGTSVVFVDIVDSTADLSTSNIVQVTGQNTIAGAGQLILHKFTVYKYSV